MEERKPETKFYVILPIRGNSFYLKSQRVRNFSSYFLIICFSTNPYSLFISLALYFQIFNRKYGKRKNKTTSTNGKLCKTQHQRKIKHKIFNRSHWTDLISVR